MAFVQIQTAADMEKAEALLAMIGQLLADLEEAIRLARGGGLRSAEDDPLSPRAEARGE